MSEAFLDELWVSDEVREMMDDLKAGAYGEIGDGEGPVFLTINFRVGKDNNLPLAPEDCPDTWRSN